MHLGTLAAVLIYFRALLVSLAGAWVQSLKLRRWDESSESRVAWLLLIATVPAGALGALLESTAEDAFRSPALVGLMLIIFSLPLVVAESVTRGFRRLGDMTVKDALFIGLAQCFALIPGVSRSGMTISGGMTRGFARQEAASFAFLLSAPIIAAAGGKQIFDLIRDGGGTSLAGELSLYLTGLLTAGVVGYVAIAFLMRYLRVGSLYVFVAYRLALGSLVIGLWLL